MSKDFLLELTTEVKFRGVEHTLSSRYEPVFSGDERDAMDVALAQHSNAIKSLFGFDE